jgi:F5/8 type C domain
MQVIRVNSLENTDVYSQLDSGVVGVGDVNLASTLYGATASASSTLGGLSASNVLGGVRKKHVNNNSHWEASTTAPSSLTIDLGVARKIECVVIALAQYDYSGLSVEPDLNTDAFGGYDIPEGTLQYSPDNITWTTFKTFSGNQPRLVQFGYPGTNTAYRYWRFNITGYKSSLKTGIASFEVWGGYPSWSNIATYTLGARVVYDRKIYESLQNSNLNKTPGGSGSGLFWLYYETPNKYKFLDGEVNTSTKIAGSVAVSFSPKEKTDSIAILDVYGASIVVYTVKRVITYNQTTNAVTSDVNTTEFNSGTISLTPFNQKQSLVFTGLPVFGYTQTYGAGVRIENRYTINVEVTGQVPFYNDPNVKELQAVGSSIGVIALGNVFDVGLSQYGASSGITSYSLKTTDEFGNTAVNKRKYSKKMTISVDIDRVDIPKVQNLLYSLDSEACVWVGSSDEYLNNSLIVYGFYKDFSNIIDYPTKSRCAIDIEGLT